MRVILYTIIILLMFAAPVTSLDVAKLQPVQSVALYTQGGSVFLETDTGSVGRGENIKEAINDLEKATPGVIYLDTAEYLLIAESALPLACDMLSYLKPSVRVCAWDERGTVEDAAKHLCVREDLPELGQWKDAKEKS